MKQHIHLNCSRHLNRGQRHRVLLSFPLLLCCRMLDKVLGNLYMCGHLPVSLVNPCEFAFMKRVQKEAEGVKPLNVDSCKQVRVGVEGLIELERCSLKSELDKIIICCIQEVCINGN